MAVSHVYPTIDFTLLDYAKIPVGAFLVGFDTSNGGKLCKLDRFGNITVVEGGGISTNYGLYTQTSSSTPITNTTSETSLLDGGIGSLTVPANGFKLGDSFRAVLTGHISSVNNHTLHIRIKSNGSILADTGVITLPATTNKNWKLDIDFNIRQIGVAGVASIASGGSFIYNKDSNNGFEGATFSVLNTTTFNTTVNNTLVITAQWGTASTGDSIYSDIFTLTKVY
jgi:hypothetical protein